MQQNPLHQSILDKVVRPELGKKSFDAEGIILYYHYYEQSADIQWTEPRTGAVRKANHISLPLRDIDGVYKKSVEIGDRVRIAFKNGEHSEPYISMIYQKDVDQSHYHSPSGAMLPKGIGFL